MCALRACTTRIDTTWKKSSLTLKSRVYVCVTSCAAMHRAPLCIMRRYAPCTYDRWEEVNFAFVILIIMIAVYNGGNFYFEIFSKRCAPHLLWLGGAPCLSMWWDGLKYRNLVWLSHNLTFALQSSPPAVRTSSYVTWGCAVPMLCVTVPATTVFAAAQRCSIAIGMQCSNRNLIHRDLFLLATRRWLPRPYYSEVIAMRECIWNSILNQHQHQP